MLIRTGMAAVLGLAAVALAAPVEVTAQQQTFVYEALPTDTAAGVYVKFGVPPAMAQAAANQVLAVEEWPSDPGHDMRSYVRFDLSGISIDPGEKVVARFYVQPAIFPSSGNPTATDPVSVSIYSPQPTPWSEATTWNSQPDLLGLPIDTVSVDGVNRFIEFDVTAAVEAWLTDPSGYNGFTLVQDSSVNDTSTGLFAGVFFNGLGVANASQRPTLAVIPEPALGGVLAAGLVALMRRRR